MEDNRYPIFCGKVLKVVREVEFPDEGCNTELHYLSGLDNITHVDAMSSLFPFISTPEGHIPIEQRIKRVVVPLKLEASVVQGSDVKTSFGEVELSNGSRRRCYELEIIHSSGDGSMFSLGKHDGFKYQKIIN